MSLSDKDRKVGYSIVQYLHQLLDSDRLDEGTTESLTVAVECLCEMFQVDLDDPEQKESLAIRANLGDLVEKAFTSDQSVKEKAEAYKTQGNTHLKMEQFEEAVDCYSKAIDLDGANATYFCNRAAAYIKLKQLEAALGDCTRAVSLDPLYARAHGRLGYIYNAMNKRKESVESFKKALELDPKNESYESNLKAVEDQINEEAGSPSGVPAGMGGMIQSMMSNPQFVEMATNMMQSSAFQEAAQRVMASGGPPGAPPIPGMMPDMMQMARDIQQNNPGLYTNLQEQARRFVPRQTDQPPEGGDEKPADDDKPADD